MWHCDEGVASWSWFGMIWMVLFWAVIVAVVVWGIRKLTSREASEPGVTSRPDSLEIAKRRYARGEISKEEFEQIKRDLT